MDREKLWITLNNIVNYHSKLILTLDNSDNDIVFLLDTIQDIHFPMMIPEQVKQLTKLAHRNHPLAGIHFLENFLDKNQAKEWNLSPDSIYTTFEECLDELKEKDLVLGFRKTYLETEEEKNLLTML